MPANKLFALAPLPALILGGGSDFGLALAESLADMGVPVAHCLRKDTHIGSIAASRQGHQNKTLLIDLPLSASSDLASSPETLAERCHVVLGEQPRYLIDLMHSRFESLLLGASPEEIEEWAANDIGLRARCVRNIGRAMLINRSGRAVFVSSSAALRPAAGQAYYAAAKSAGEALYRSFALEMADRGLSACSLRLGLLDIGRGGQYLKQHKEKILPATPGKKLVSLDEAMAVIMFLLSPAAESINAVSVTMDRGFSAVKNL